MIGLISLIPHANLEALLLGNGNKENLGRENLIGIMAP